VTDKEVK